MEDTVEQKTEQVPEQGKVGMNPLWPGLAILASLLAAGVILSICLNIQSGFGGVLGQAISSPIQIALGLWPLTVAFILISVALAALGLWRRSRFMAWSGFAMLGCTWLLFVGLSLMT